MASILASSALHMNNLNFYEVTVAHTTVNSVTIFIFLLEERYLKTCILFITRLAE
jgi:hypothetical protein